MDEKQFQKLTDYIRVLANRMRLADWEFQVLTEPASEESLAEIRCGEKRKVATVRVCADFFELPPEERHHALVHELIHPHLHATHSAVSDLQRYMGAQEYAIFHDRFVEALEYGVDALADAFAPCLPSLDEMEA
jgi:hypothetical protein